MFPIKLMAFLVILTNTHDWIYFQISNDLLTANRVVPLIYTKSQMQLSEYLQFYFMVQLKIIWYCQSIYGTLFKERNEIFLEYLRKWLTLLKAFLNSFNYLGGGGLTNKIAAIVARMFICSLYICRKCTNEISSHSVKIVV